jgi:hypothetical protein
MKNPLDQFQSHSIHYVMLAARSTEDVRGFTVDSQQAQSETLSAIDATKKLGDKVQMPGAAAAYLLIDTRRFSQFMVNDFELETMMTGFAVPGSRTPSSTAINMKFTVIDSLGIQFANFLQYIMDQQLQVSYDGMTLLVRVLFIGHRADGTTQVVQSLTIPAIFKQIQVDLNDVKGVYTCTLYPLIGMPSNSRNNAKWTSIGAASSYFSGENANTLGAVVNAFERQLNEVSLKRYAQVNGQTTADGTKVSVGRFGRPVQYMITLPKGWAEFKFSGPTQGGATETVFAELVKVEASKSASAAEAQKKAQQNSSAPAKDSFVAVNPSLSIPEVLDVIFSQCLEVAQLGNFTKKQDQDGNLKFYKHLVTVTSDDASFTVHVDIVEFIVPNVDLATGAKSNSVGANDAALYELTEYKDGSSRRRPKQFIEYDYIFSGTNIDVLHLDLKIENLNILLMQGSKLGQGELFSKVADGQDQGDGTSVGSDEHPVFGRRKKDPALMPPRSTGDDTNFSTYGANARTVGEATPQAIAQQYTQNLQAFYAAGPVEAKLELRGNPDLMVMVSLQSIPQHVSAVTITSEGGVSSNVNADVKKEYRAAFEKNLLRYSGINDSQVNTGSSINSKMLTGTNFVSSPLFAKVNVYGPNVDFLTGAANPGDYGTKLFYDNYYFVDKVISKIEGSKFTQELAMRSFSLYNFPNTATRGATSDAVPTLGRPRGGQ